MSPEPVWDLCDILSELGTGQDLGPLERISARLFPWGMSDASSAWLTQNHWSAVYCVPHPPGMAEREGKDHYTAVYSLVGNGDAAFSSVPSTSGHKLVAQYPGLELAQPF